MSGKRADYLPLYWDGAPDYEVFRGHVSEADALYTLSQEGIELPSPLVLNHGYARFIPAPAGAPYDTRLEPCAKGRGAFPVTFVEVS